jgi:membrane protein DedA with SNARE-associated domain
VVRAFTSLVAGFVEVPALQFGVLSLIGTVVYAATVTLVGYGFGSAWDSVAHYIAIGGYAIVAIVVIAVGAFIIYRLRELRKEAASSRESTLPPAL